MHESLISMKERGEKKKKLLSSVPSLFSARVHEYREFLKTDIFVM